MKIPKQEYTAEFKELAVKRVRDGQAVSAVAKELGLIEQTLHNWSRPTLRASSMHPAPGRSPRKKWSCPGCVPKTSGCAGSAKS
jgi:transposase-like protein